MSRERPSAGVEGRPRRVGEKTRGERRADTFSNLITTEPNRRVISRASNRPAAIRTVVSYRSTLVRQMRLTGGGGATSAASTIRVERSSGRASSGRATRVASDSVRATMSSRSLRFLAMSASLRSSNRRRSSRSRCVARDSRGAGGVAAGESAPTPPSAARSRGGPEMGFAVAAASLAFVSGSSVPSASPPPRFPNLLAHPPPRSRGTTPAV